MLEAYYLGQGEKRAGLLHSGPKSKYFCISFGNQLPRVWMKSGETPNSSCFKSSVTFLQSLMIWGVMLSSGVARDWCTTFYQVQSQQSLLPGDFTALHPSIC